MIDLKKPLEGGSGLLLMAALILFGAMVGIACALMFSWIPMSEVIANFLGGAVGAGLGAAIGVLGVMYVQRRQQRQRLTASMNSIRDHADALAAVLKPLGGNLRKLTQQETRSVFRKRRLEASIDVVEKELELFPNGVELPLEIHAAIQKLKWDLRSGLSSLRDYGVRWRDKSSTNQDLECMAEVARAPLSHIQNLRTALNKF